MSSFVPVTREQAKLRMALQGVSGGGKTLGALYLAYGITGDWSKVALVDTERERGRHYANREDEHLPYPTGEFLYCPLYAPYSPQRYIALVEEGARAVGEDGVLIIDSLSHAWSDEGGVLDIKEQIARSGQRGMNDYTAWNEAGREQKKLVNAIFGAQCHIIATMRTKMEYALETNEKGRQQPIKLGLKPIQRDETEYEFDVVLNIARNHVATSGKDVTFLDNLSEPISPDLGRSLIAWLKQGTAPVTCSDCGMIIRGSAKKTREEIIEASNENAGRPLCLDCYAAWYHSGDNAEQADENESAAVEAAANA